MTTHLVQQIVTAAEQRLTGLASTGSHVFDGEPRALTAAELPALVLLDGADQVLRNLSSGYPRVVLRTLFLTVRAKVKESAPPALLRQIRLEVETALLAKPPLGGLVKDLRSPDVGEREIDYDSETPAAVLSMTFPIDYSYQETAPGAAY